MQIVFYMWLQVGSDDISTVLLEFFPWAALKLPLRTSSWSSKWVQGSMTWAILCGSPRTKAGSWMRNGTIRTQTNALMEYQHLRWKLSRLLPHTSPSSFSLLCASLWNSHLTAKQRGTDPVSPCSAVFAFRFLNSQQPSGMWRRKSGPKDHVD